MRKLQIKLLPCLLTGTLWLNTAVMPQKGATLLGQAEQSWIDEIRIKFHLAKTDIESGRQAAPCRT